jgi:putative membrane protein
LFLIALRPFFWFYLLFRSKDQIKICIGDLFLLPFFFSILFLISYVCSHLIGERIPLQLSGIIKIFFYTILITHVPLAIFNVFLVPRTLYLGLTGQYDKHRQLAPWAFNIWLYVSITGVIIYLLQC